jgi:hypothetical protein
MPPLSERLVFGLAMIATGAVSGLLAGLAHALSNRRLEIGFGLFPTVVSIRFFYSLL